MKRNPQKRQKLSLKRNLKKKKLSCRCRNSLMMAGQVVATTFPFVGLSKMGFE